MLTRRIPPIAPWNSAGPIWAWLQPLESWPGSPADPGAAAAAIDPPMPLLLRAKWRKFHRELIQKIFQKKIWKNMEKMLTGAWSRPWFTMNFWGKWLFDLWKYDNEAVDLGYILPYLQTNPYVETISGFLFWWNRNTSGFDSVEALTIFSSCSVRSRSAWEDTSVACIVASSTWLSWKNKLSLRGWHSHHSAHSQFLCYNTVPFPCLHMAVCQNQ